MAYFVPGDIIVSFSRFRREMQSTLDRLILSFCLSVLTTTLVLLFSSLVSVPFYFTVYVMSLACIALEAWRGYRNFQSMVHKASKLPRLVRLPWQRLSKFEKLVVIVVTYQVLILVLIALYWPVYTWDALAYWLYLGRVFFQEGTLHVTHHQLWMDLPNNGGSAMAYPWTIPLLYAWLFTSVNGVSQMLASTVQVAFLFLLVAVVFRLYPPSRSSRLSSVFCLFLLVFMPAFDIQFDVFKGAVNLPLMAATFALFYFGCRLWRNPNADNALTTGVVAGLTAAVKQLGLVFAFLVGLGILLKTDRPINVRVRAFVIYLACASILSGPFYLYSISRAPSETVSYYTLVIPMSALAIFEGFTSSAIQGLFTRAWGIAPLLALFGVFVFRKMALTKMTMLWILGSLTFYFLFVIATPLGSLEINTLANSTGTYALPIYSFMVVPAGAALGAVWERARNTKLRWRKLYAVSVASILILSVGMSVGMNYGSFIGEYSVPPFLSTVGVVQRNTDQNYLVKLGGFYTIANFIEYRTESDSAILSPGYYRYFFFDGSDHRKLYGIEEKPGLWTKNLTELRCQLATLNTSNIYLVYEPWYKNIQAYSFYFESAIYGHKADVSSQVLATSDGYALYKVRTTFLGDSLCGAKSNDNANLLQRSPASFPGNIPQISDVSVGHISWPRNCQGMSLSH